MGLFDRLLGKRTDTPQPAATATATEPATALPSGPAATASASALPRLAAARELLDAKDLPGAIAIYEKVLAEAGDRADVLVTISGDLGVRGHLQEIIDLIAPRYDAERHGAAIGINILQAYLALRDANAAQHVLDLLFALRRPSLEDRLHGFSNAIAELIEAQQQGITPAPSSGENIDTATPQISLITIGKPVWYYGLESIASSVLPQKTGSSCRIAFAPLALINQPESSSDEAPARLARALPCWFAETLYFCPRYEPFAVVALANSKENVPHHAVFNAEWTAESLRQLVGSTKEGFDFAITGALYLTGDGYELALRLWDAKKFRERKQFTVRWTPATADAELTRLHVTLCQFMEFASYPPGQGIACATPASPSAWLDMLGVSLDLFLADKKLLAASRLSVASGDIDRVAAQAASSATASLAWLTLRARASRLGLASGVAEPALDASPIVEKARLL